MLHEEARMKAIVDQVAGELASQGIPAAEAGVMLVVYGGTLTPGEAAALFERLSAGTGAEGVTLKVRIGGTQYICWNCCGLRFEAEDGVCPNCGETAVILPDEVAFGVRDVSRVE